MGETFRHRDLAGAQFDDVSLEGARITDANMKRVTLTNVTLEGARFSDVDLRGVTIENARLDGMTVDGIDIAPLVRAELARRAR